MSELEKKVLSQKSSSISPEPQGSPAESTEEFLDRFKDDPVTYDYLKEWNEQEGERQDSAREIREEWDRLIASGEDPEDIPESENFRAIKFRG